MNESFFQLSTLPSSTQAALRCAGYETVDDLGGVSAKSLSEELGITIGEAQSLISATQAPKAAPVTQSAASLARVNVFSCKYPAVNKVLGGGLLRSHILEISGPPGSFKEALACDFVRMFVEAGEEVVFAGESLFTLYVFRISKQYISTEDMQNMTSPHAIARLFENECPETVYYERVHTLPDLIIFLHSLNLEVLRKSHPDLNPSKKNAILGKIRQSLLEMCMAKNLTVVITSQMSTKILHADGSPATFESGAKAVMVPQLGPCILPWGS
ncbi:hypothetical protein ID866_4372 [Astraeus odoratus]|nr:hypothetical protein ID866_4372 [Astraeus odoratus]